MIDVKYLLNEVTHSMDNGDETGSAVLLAAAAICERPENLDATLRLLDGTLLDVLRDQNEILARSQS